MRRRGLGALLRVTGFESYHGLLLREAVEPHLDAAKRRGHAPGRLLALGATALEARALAALPFDEIVLTGVLEPDDALAEACERHRHVRYELANAEALADPSASFDLVLAKEVLHHLARPVLGLYEMLRVCRRRAVFVEPWSCAGLAALDRLGVTTRIERGQAGNLRTRDNHVHRWSRGGLDALLASYYLDSGARADVCVGWLSSRVLMRRAPALRTALLAGGWAASWLPGAAGNLATVSIEPGADLPPDPTPLRG